MRNVNHIIASGLFATALATVAGCYGGNGGYYNDRYGYASERYYYYDDPYPDHYYRDHRDYHRHARRIRVPRDADVVATGDGSLAYTADKSGRVYVRDERTGKVIFRDRVKPGQTVTVNPGRPGVAIDGRTEKAGLSKKPREREVFFRPDRGAEAKAQRQERAAARSAERQAVRASARQSKSSGGGKKSD